MESTTHETDHKLRLSLVGASTSTSERKSGNLLEELLSVVLHDLRSPLGAVGVLVELISTLSKAEKPADQHQIQLLQDAVSKAQRVMDDAVEIQSVIRGTSTFTPVVMDIENLVRSCLEKAGHAPHFRNVDVNYTTDGTREKLVRIDVEKSEAALLCVFEHVAGGYEKASNLKIYQTAKPPHVNLHVINTSRHSDPSDTQQKAWAARQLRGRLGSRRLGESRYSISVCREVMRQMGGNLELNANANDYGVIIGFPMAALV